VAGSFTRLIVYRLAVELADELHARAVAFPRLDRWSLGIQLIRAADSVGANIAESAGRWHEQDKRRLLMIARGTRRPGARHKHPNGRTRASAKRSDQAPELTELSTVNCQLDS
jgi:hypothetical protein